MSCELHQGTAGSGVVRNGTHTFKTPHAVMISSLTTADNSRYVKAKSKAIP
jgi:hypothetical protein